MVVRSTPFSPWMPRPNSISSSPISKPGLPTDGTMQAPSATPIGTERRSRAARDAGDFGERQAAFGGRARKLVDEHGAGDAAAAVARDEVAQRHVVGDDHHLDRDALLAGKLGGEAEIQPVAGVVLHRPSTAPAGPLTARIAASTASVLGEVKTSPATAAVSMPRPT